MRVFVDIPNDHFEKIVQQYGFWKGRPVFTSEQQHVTLLNYCYYANIHN